MPRIGRLRLDALGPQDVRRLLNSCREATVSVAATDGEPVSPRTVQMVHAVLRNAVEHAVREELVPRNVVKLVRVPAPHYEVGTGLSLAQARRLLAVVAKDRLRAVYVLALSVGLRGASCWGCGGSMSTWTVPSCTSARRRSGWPASCSFTAPKTRHSRRSLPLPPLAVDALREHRARQAAERLSAGPAWQDSGLVFTTAHGTPIEPRNLNRHWYGAPGPGRPPWRPAARPAAHLRDAAA